MAEAYKILAQAAPLATSLTDVYTVPALTSAVISTVTLCNQSGAGITVRVSVAKAGAADAPKQYLVYDSSISANSTVTIQVGATLATTDVLRVYVSSASISVNVFGTEIT